MTVSETQIEAAANAIHREIAFGKKAFQPPNVYELARAALTAALSDQPKEPLGIVRRIGWIRNKDIDPGADDDAGRFLGVVIEYPNGPPSFSPRVVWDKTPVRIVIVPPPSSTAGEG